MNYDNFIKLNSNSLEEMFYTSYATNVDDKVNVKYTLSGIKEKLLRDIYVIDKLLENAKEIESIDYDNDRIGITVKENIRNKLLETKIITDDHQPNEEDYNIYNVIDQSATSKLNKILKVTTLDENESDNEEPKLIFDEKSFRDIQSYYHVLNDVESSYFSNSDSDSDFE